MKTLTYSRMALARLRANKRGYASLAVGIFLSIFLISCMVFGAYGANLAQLQVGYDKVGHADMVIMDNDTFGDKEIQALNQYDRIGHAYILGQVENANLYVGYYDEIGVELLDIAPVSGRLPEAAGEIALEATAMDVLETRWVLGDTVELTVAAIDGETETRSYTLVGILPERSTNLEVTDWNGIHSFPAIVTSRDEPSFAVGRVGVNYVLERKEDVSQKETLEALWKVWEDGGLYLPYFYSFKTNGEQVQFTNSFYSKIGINAEIFSLLFMAGCLVAALVLSCAVGISGAMEGLLMKRREEIGVLRALGATRRQIRRMFGRENLLLAVVLTPASIAVSLGAVWLLSQLFASKVKFGFHMGLLVPIFVFSVAVILLAGYLPLVRASKLMPMSVIRDTAMLRKSKRVKSRKSFSAPRLISSRQVRLNLSRQIGAALLVGLMLMCSSLLVVLVSEYRSWTNTESEGFILRNEIEDSLPTLEPISYREDPISDRSIAQMRSLDNVKSVTVNRKMPVVVSLDTVPSYAVFTNTQYGILDDELLEKCLELMDSDSFSEYMEQHKQEYREKYRQFCKTYQIDGEAYSMYLVTVDLTQEKIDRLQDELQFGKIDLDAINAGREVLVVAPEFWVHSRGGGSYTYYDSLEAAELNGHPDAERMAWNNVFTAGQSLPLMQLYDMGDGGKTVRNDETVTVGAVLSSFSVKSVWVYNDCYLVTTEQGLKNMSIRPDGIESLYVYLEGEVTQEEEETLEQQITAISRRSGSWTVSNEVKSYREARQEDRQQILLFLSVTTVFFAVAVGMIVSAVTRQLQSEGRTIGMLRAVGADEKAILGCYSGSVRAGVVGGFAISMLLWSAWFALYAVEMISRAGKIPAYIWMTLGKLVGCSVVMALLCNVACRILLRKRIREIVNRSIIDNIKEL